MKPVMQTRLGADGNCFEACIASILEIPLEEVPDLGGAATPEKWATIINVWLAKRGLQYVELDYQEDGDALWRCISTYHIIIGHELRGVYHAVVGKNGKPVHDPYPGGAEEFVWGGDFTRLGFLICTGEKA